MKEISKIIDGKRVIVKKPELLAPAGSLEKLKIAVMYGADAVFIGGREFGLRSNAQNFSLSINKYIDIINLDKVRLDLYSVNNQLLDLARQFNDINANLVDAVRKSEMAIVEDVFRKAEITIVASDNLSARLSRPEREIKLELIKKKESVI